MLRALMILACLLTTSCSSIERLFRNSPLSGVEIDDDRVNLWPLYYESDGRVAVLWPVFDQDEKGFALRPLITKDGTNWEVLPPLCWFDTATGEWVFLPAWSMVDSHGVFPLYTRSERFNHVGPFVWGYDEEGEFEGFGLLPVLGWTDEFKFIGPVWWRDGKDGAAGGLFPLVTFGQQFNNVGPVIWNLGEGGVLDSLIAFPLFGFGKTSDGGSVLVTLLGGRGTNAKGDTTFINILGPVFHHQSGEDTESTGVLLPLFYMSSGPGGEAWDVWPVVGRATRKDAEGKVVEIETTALSGLVRHAGMEDTEALRFLPLFSYRSAAGGAESFVDYLSLVGYKDYKSGGSSFHFATPMVFNYRSNAEGYRWDSLLGTVHYEQEGDRSEFRLLYYLYRQKTDGTETRRDLFPFISWDSGEKRSGFSFLWRLFNWQRRGDKVGGHILFIPWGDL